MRIGMVTGEYPPMQGGVGAYSAILARTLAAKGHQVHVFSTREADERHPSIRMQNIVKGWGPASLRSLRSWTQEHELHAVILQYQTAAFGMSPWIHFIPDVLRNTALVTTFHDLLFPYLFPKAGPLRDWIVMRLARGSDGVIVTNHEDMQRVKHLPHAALIPIGSNIPTELPADYKPTDWRKKAGADSDDVLIAHFGFVNHSKGLETLLEALAILRVQDRPVRLVMIGGRTGSSDPTNPAYAAIIDGLIDQLQLVPWVHWTGFVDDKEVAAYLQAADIVVLPFRDGASYRRGSLMAAIHHGCAIITTQPRVDVPAFHHEENMLLFPAEDSADLAQSITRLADNPALREQLDTGVNRLRHQFDWESIADTCIVHIERILDARGYQQIRKGTS